MQEGEIPVMTGRLLGLRLDALCITELNEIIRNISLRKNRAIISNLNVYACNLAAQDASLTHFFNHSSEYVFCDGHGVMMGARMLGLPIAEKITYAHWFPIFCDYAEEHGLTVFLLGAKPGVAELAKKRLRKNRPRLKIVGVMDGYFDKSAGSEENSRVIDAINRVKPNVLLVSFGMPMQERWLADNWHSINANVALTGGAAIDYMAGESRRPPKWLTDYGFEWLGRMLYEPRRLWRRYILGNPLFFIRVLREVWCLRVLKKSLY